LGLADSVLFVFWGLFGFLIGVSGCVWVWFGALSMLFSVKLQHGWREARNVAKSDVHHDAVGLGTKFQKKKAASPFSLLLPV